MMRNDYRRSLILLRSNAAGYSGHVRLERRTLMGTMYFLMQSGDACPTLRVALVGKGRCGYFACAVGETQRDSRGQAVLSYSFDPRNICGHELEEYQLIAVTCAGDEGCEAVLFGNVCGHAQLNWADVRAALRTLYYGNVADARSTPGDAGSSATVSGEAGSGATGSGATVSGEAGSGVSGSGATVSGEAGAGATGSGVMVSGEAVAGATGSGTTVTGEAVAGATGSGTTVTGEAGAGATGSSATGFSLNASEAAAPDEIALGATVPGEAVPLAEPSAYLEEASVQAERAATAEPSIAGAAANSVTEVTQSENHVTNTLENVTALTDAAPEPTPMARPSATIGEDFSGSAIEAGGNRAESSGVQRESSVATPLPAATALLERCNFRVDRQPWPESVEPLRELFLREAALRAAPDDGCVYVAAPMPRESGYAYIAAGLVIVDGALTAVRYALPAAWTQDAPAGLEDYAWVGDQNKGWWCIELPLDE